MGTRSFRPIAGSYVRLDVELAALGIQDLTFKVGLDMRTSLKLASLWSGYGTESRTDCWQVKTNRGAALRASRAIQDSSVRGVVRTPTLSVIDIGSLWKAVSSWSSRLTGMTGDGVNDARTPSVAVHTSGEPERKGCR